MNIDYKLKIDQYYVKGWKDGKWTTSWTPINNISVQKVELTASLISSHHIIKVIKIKNGLESWTAITMVQTLNRDHW